MLIHYNGGIFILNTRLSLEGWKGLLSYKRILLCFIQKCFEVPVMTVVVLVLVLGHLEPGSRRKLSLMQPLSLCFCPLVGEKHEISVVTKFLRNETRRKIHFLLPYHCP